MTDDALCFSLVLLCVFACGVMACGGDDDDADASVDAAPDAVVDTGVDANVDVGVDAPGDACTLCGPEVGDGACSDGFDNDGDGDLDCADDECMELVVCEERNVRVIAANLSGVGQAWNAGHGLRILAGLQGDVLLVQELNFGDNGAAALTDFATQSCGTECEVFRGRGMIPNGVVSRFPVLDADVWDDPETDSREFAWARIDVPGAIDLWAVSIHFLTSSGAERERQAEALVNFLDFEVPESDLLVVGGDFNIGSGPVFDRLSARVVIPIHPTDNVGNPNTNAPRSRVLDGVLASSALHGAERPVQIGDASFPGGLVVDTRVFTPIEDLAPALVDDSGAPDMQHMAVVRDFGLRGI